MKPEGPLGEHSGSPEKEPKPNPELQQAIVQCEGFRCLAFLKKDGTWVDQRGKPLKVIKVITRF